MKCSAKYCKSFQARKTIHKTRFHSGHISWNGSLWIRLVYFPLAQDWQKYSCT